MYSEPDLSAQNERKAKRIEAEEHKDFELRTIACALERLKVMSDRDDAIGVVEAGTINWLILIMEACLLAIRAHIKV